MPDAYACRGSEASQPGGELLHEPSGCASPVASSSKASVVAEPSHSSVHSSAAPVKRLPVVIFLHATGQSLDCMRPKQELWARMGYLTAAIDLRYHGRRAVLPPDLAAAVAAAADRASAAAGPGPGLGAAGTGSASASSLSLGAGAPGGGGAAHAAASAAVAKRAAAAVATLKGLDARTLSALERADIAAGYLPAPGALSPSASAVSLAAQPSAGSLPVPVGTPRDTARLRSAAAWLKAVEDVRKHLGPDAAAAALATLPPATNPSAAGTPLLPSPEIAIRSLRGRGPCGVVAAATGGATCGAGAAGAASGGGGGAAGGASPTRGSHPQGFNPNQLIYELALVAAWRGSGERPFLLDMLWDVLHLLDILVARRDVDSSRVGVTGLGVGGMVAWLCCAADPRVAVGAPVQAVGSFAHDIALGSFGGRVASIPLVFRAAASDMGHAEVDAAVVTAVWDRLCPGLLTSWDAPLALGRFAPRPLLIYTMGDDDRCTLVGAQAAYDSLRQVYLAWAREQRNAGRAAAAAAKAAAAGEGAGTGAEAGDGQAAAGGSGAEGAPCVEGGGGQGAAGEEGGDAGAAVEGVAQVPPADGGVVVAEASQGSVAGPVGGHGSAAGSATHTPREQGADGSCGAGQESREGRSSADQAEGGQEGQEGEGGEGEQGEGEEEEGDEEEEEQSCEPAAGEGGEEELDEEAAAMKAARKTAVACSAAARAASKAAAEVAEAAAAGAAAAAAAAAEAAAEATAAVKAADLRDVAEEAVAEAKGVAAEAEAAAQEAASAAEAAAAEAAKAAAAASEAKSALDAAVNASILTRRAATAVLAESRVVGAAAAQERAAAALAGGEEAAAAAQLALEAAHAANAAAAAAAVRARAIAEAAVAAEAAATEALAGTRLEFVVERGVGHVETGASQQAVERFMHTHLLWCGASGKGID